MSFLDWNTNLVPRKGALALCRIGLLGVITSDAPVEVTYADGKKGLAWTGEQIAHRTFISPYTSQTITVKPGDPWSSRRPIVIGYTSKE
jgi:hypothetical protein